MFMRSPIMVSSFVWLALICGLHQVTQVGSRKAEINQERVSDGPLAPLKCGDRIDENLYHPGKIYFHKIISPLPPSLPPSVPLRKYHSLSFRMCSAFWGGEESLLTFFCSLIAFRAENRVYSVHTSIRSSEHVAGFSYIKSVFSPKMLIYRFNSFLIFFS